MLTTCLFLYRKIVVWHWENARDPRRTQWESWELGERLVLVNRWGPFYSLVECFKALGTFQSWDK